MTTIISAPRHITTAAVPYLHGLATHYYHLNDVNNVSFAPATGRDHGKVAAASERERKMRRMREGLEGARYVINLGVLLRDIESGKNPRTREAIKLLYEWLSFKVAAHLSREFKDCDPDYENEAKAVKALQNRIASTHDWETTDVAVCVKTIPDTGQQKLLFVGTAGLREFDNTELRDEGPVWFGDYVIDQAFRGTGDGKAMYFIVNARAADYLDKLPKEAESKVRLFTEPHNDTLYKVLGTAKGSERTITNADKQTSEKQPTVDVTIRYVNPQACADVVSEMQIRKLRKGPGLA